MTSAKPTRAEMAALVERLRDDAHEYAVAEMFEETITVERQAAAAIEALMQERAEPVAFRWHHKGPEAQWNYGDSPEWAKDYIDKYTVQMLYAAPPAKPAGELPPLPAPAISGINKREGTVEGPPLFTAEQVIAYALRADGMNEREQAQQHAARLEAIADQISGANVRRELRYAATFLRALADRPEPAQPVAYLFQVRDTIGATPTWREFAAIDFTEGPGEEVISKLPLVLAANPQQIASPKENENG